MERTAVDSGAEEEFVVGERAMEFDEMGLRELLRVLRDRSSSTVHTKNIEEGTNEIGILHRAKHEISLGDIDIVDRNINSGSS